MNAIEIRHLTKSFRGLKAVNDLSLTVPVGAMIGGAISGLPFTMEGFNAANLIASLVAKLFLVGVFAAIAVALSVVAKQKTWLSVCLCLAVGVLLFMMIPMMTPLNAGILHVILCLAGGVAFAFGLGAVSNLILNKTNILYIP